MCMILYSSEPFWSGDALIAIALLIGIVLGACLPAAVCFRAGEKGTGAGCLALGLLGTFLYIPWIIAVVMAAKRVSFQEREETAAFRNVGRILGILMLGLGVIMLVLALRSISDVSGNPFAGFYMNIIANGLIGSGYICVLGLVTLLCAFRSGKGFWGWIYFVLRVSWHIGMCWIPGVWYGIQAIRLEKKELDQSGTARPEAARPPRPAAVSPVSQPVPQPAFQKASAPAQSLQPASQKAVEQAARPALSGVTGIFAGTDFPVQADEELAIGSDPSVCQIVLPAECAAPIHCSLRYDSRRGCWQVRDLTDGQTFENGVRAIRTGVFEDIPKGRLICVGQGKYSQRFRLG